MEVDKIMLFLRYNHSNILGSAWSRYFHLFCGWKKNAFCTNFVNYLIVIERISNHTIWRSIFFQVYLFNYIYTSNCLPIYQKISKLTDPVFDINFLFHYLISFQMGLMQFGEVCKHFPFVNYETYKHLYSEYL